MPLTRFPHGIAAFPVIGATERQMFAGSLVQGDNNGNVWFVDGDNGSDGNDGLSPESPLLTIAQAVSNATAGAVIYVKQRKTVALSTDPAVYAETVIIPNTKPNISLIGVGTGRVQGGMPEIKKGSGTTALITVRAPGFHIENFVLNGASSTGGGILLDDDGTTKVAFGFSAYNNHFKNCAGHATDGTKGGAITWSANGGAWQAHIYGNRFYKNLADIVLLGTAQSVPQDVVIEKNVFSGPAASVDVNLYLAGGSGMNGVIIRDNDFTCFPAAAGGAVGLFMDLTGCVGLLSNNNFASNAKTFKAAGSGAKVPATVFIGANWQEATAAGGTTSGMFGRSS